MNSSNFDYIVVGAGAAGCPIAARLIESGASVLLIEGGAMNSDKAIQNSDIGSMVSLWGSDYDWKYTTEKKDQINHRSIDIAQGKVCGGGTSINAMMYVRGSAKDFDRWSSYGNKGWSYSEVLPYFKKSETYHGPITSYRGQEGPLDVIPYPNPSQIAHAFMGAANEMGFSHKEIDYNGEIHQNAPFLYQSTRTTNLKRCDTFTAFVAPLLENPLLSLVTKAIVTKVIFDGDVAKGVEYVESGKTCRVTAECEIILSAGAFASPKILMFSGIGDSEQLKANGIQVKNHLPGVGKNLHDHMLLGVGFKSKIELDPPGLLSEAGIFTYAIEKDSDINSPDLQLFSGPVQFLDPEYKIDGPGFTFAPIIARPLSRGEVSLKSANPLENLSISPGYLSHQQDIDVFIYAIDFCRRLAATKSFKGIMDYELAPGEKKVSKADLTSYIRQSASTVWHPVGTCKMGTNDNAVVDERLRVRGISRLRIADASIMPDITSGNTNAATIMIGEKAASMIIEDNSV